MKKLIIAAIAFASFSASAMNMNIGYPVDASRMSLTGSVEFTVNCETKEIAIHKSSSYIFDKHIKRNVHVMCYGDKSTKNIAMNFNKGKIGHDDLIASQTSRRMMDDAVIN